MLQRVPDNVSARDHIAGEIVWRVKALQSFSISLLCENEELQVNREERLYHAINKGISDS